MGKRFDPLVARGGNGRFARVINFNCTAGAAKKTVVSATVVHVDPKKFWTERVTLNRTRSPGAKIPLWDRQAHIAIMLSRPVAPPEEPATAFRKLIDAWKAMLFTKIAMTKALLLPQLTVGAVDGLARERNAAEKEKKTDGEEKK